MKAQRQVQRTLIERHDAERRWDYAFQFLLSWVREAGSDTSFSQDREETQNEGCPLRTGIDQSAAATAND